jgi:hypothetical protein
MNSTIQSTIDALQVLAAKYGADTEVVFLEFYEDTGEADMDRGIKPNVVEDPDDCNKLVVVFD